MNGYGYHGKTVLTFATAAEVSTSMDVREYNRVAIEMASFVSLLATATANVYVQGRFDSTGTYKKIKQMGVYSAVSGLGDWELPSTEGNFLAVCDAALGFADIRFQLSTVATDGAEVIVHTFK